MYKRFHDSIFQNAERNATAEMRDIVERIEFAPAPGMETDRFGYCPPHLYLALPTMLFLYRKYHRVEVFWAENIPPRGAALLIGNHSGVIPIDGLMAETACLVETQQPRLARGMYEKWISGLPFIHDLYMRMGHATGLVENAEAFLENGDMLLVFPEGAKGISKTWDKRYKLQSFGMGFVEMAVKYKAPIIPMAVIGGEEQMINLHNSRILAKALKMPVFPITPTWPLLGALGGLWAPTKYRIYFGDPILFDDYGLDALQNPDLVRELVEQVKMVIQEMIVNGLAKRKEVFF